MLRGVLQWLAILARSKQKFNPALSCGWLGSTVIRDNPTASASGKFELRLETQTELRNSDVGCNHSNQGFNDYAKYCSSGILLRL